MQAQPFWGLKSKRFREIAAFVRPAFGNPLHADHCFFVAASTISWIIDFECSGVLSPEREFLVGSGSLESSLLWPNFPISQNGE